jgi:SpoVK/Ycf46/Vps4 family AAA+-type ATPase
VLAGIRSEWYGKTDAFTEMFRETIAAFGRIIVVVDEAHVAFGSIHSPGVHETERRLTGNIIQIMDDEALRSKVFWALMTTRPDLLDPDIVRRGRCSLFIPVFDPEGEDAEEFLRWMLARFEKRGIVLSPEEVELVRQRSKLFSAGDYREFIADFIAERRLDAAMSVEQFLASWTPSAVALAEQRELQIHLAALRCDWDELLPARLRDLTREELQRRLAQY